MAVDKDDDDNNYDDNNDDDNDDGDDDDSDADVKESTDDVIDDLGLGVGKDSLHPGLFYFLLSYIDQSGGVRHLASGGAC